MKKIMFIILMLLSANFLIAQATEGVVTYQKKQQSAAIIVLPYSPDMVNAVMGEYLSKKGSTGTDIKGFKTFRNTQLNPNDSINADLYFKVERTNRSEKDQSTISLMVGVPNEDIANRNPGSNFGMDKAKEFLNSLMPVMEAYNLELRIKAQNDLISKEEKKAKSIIDDAGDLAKRRSDIDRKIEGNKQDQEKQNGEVEKQKQALAVLVSQRKS